MPELEERLRAHLDRVVATPPAVGMEERILRPTAPPAAPRRRAWLGQVLASAALIAVAAGLFYGLRLSRDHGVTRPKPAPSATAIPSPTPSNVQPRPSQVVAVHMVSASVGWGLTNQGVLRTTDDWSHWANVGPVGAALSGAGAEFLDGTTAWLATTQGSATGTISIFRTSDAGQSWQPSSLTDAQNVGPGELDFIDAAHGWLFVPYSSAAGSQGVALYQTTDGGSQWIRVEQTPGPVQAAPGSLPFACHKTGVAFLNAGTGWATGDCAGGSPFFYVTHDGGRTWAKQALVGPSNLALSAGSALTPPDFLADGSGHFTLMANATEVVYTTSDGGATWTAHSLPTGGPGQSPVVAFSSLLDGWVVSADGATIYRSQDGGGQWSSFHPAPALTQLQSLDPVDAAHAVAIVNPSGNQDVLLVTTDGGRTWK